MKDKTTGLVLLCLGVLLYATQHVLVFATQWNAVSIPGERINELLGLNRGMLAVAALLAAAGVVCLVRAARQDSADD